MESRYTLIFTSDYDKNFADIIEYCEETYGNMDFASRLTKKIQKKTQVLKIFPYVYPLYESNKLTRFHYRWFIVDNYKVFYHVDDIMKIVFLDSIRYVRMDFKNMYI